MDDLKKALQFCRDLASEEYPHQQNNIGAEIVLRHIIKKCDEVLANKSVEPTLDAKSVCPACGIEHKGLRCPKVWG